MDMWKVLDRRINDLVSERPIVEAVLSDSGLPPRFAAWRLRDALREAGLNVGTVGTRVADAMMAPAR